MPPKLRKDRSTPGAKPAPTTTSNKFEPLSETHPLKTPSKHASTTMVDDAPTNPPSELQFDTMKDDIASMVQVIKSLSTSLHKMDKLDKIDIIEARKKFTEITITEMITDLRYEIDHIKTKTEDSSELDSPSYADILKTTQKSNKNQPSHNDMTKDLEQIKNKTPEKDNEQSMSQPGSNKGTKVPKNVTTIPNVKMMTTSKEDDTIMQHRTNSTVHVPKLPTVTNTNNSDNNNIQTYSSINMDHDHDLEDDSSNENNKTFPTKTHKYWKIVATETYQPHRFLQYMENINLNGDTISHLRQFYERIRLAFHSSFCKPTDILPPFKQISPNHTFDQLLIPENQYYLGHHSIMNTYNWFSSTLYASLTDTKTISTKLSPLAYRVIHTNRIYTDGWHLFYHLLSTRNSLLGGKGDDVISEIMNLRIKQDDNTHTFYDRVVNIQEN